MQAGFPNCRLRAELPLIFPIKTLMLSWQPKRPMRMEILADVNVLLALSDPLHGQHRRCSEWFSGLSESDHLLVCRVAQMGLLRLITNSRVMDGRALTLRDAWSFYGEFVQDPSVSTVYEPEGLQSCWVQLCWDRGASTKMVTDTYLAAFAIAGDYALVSLDKGFAQYPGLDWILPA